MGRCYEFGVTIEDGCDHAMVVSPEGGVCVCSECGAGCRGRFGGCASILARPGHVPIAAPRHLVEPHAAPRQATVPLLPVEAAAGPSPSVTAPGAAALDALHGVPALVEAVGEAIAALREDIRQRDDEFVAIFERLSEAYDRVARELATDRSARAGLADAVTDLTRRLEALEERPDPSPLRLRFGRP